MSQDQEANPVKIPTWDNKIGPAFIGLCIQSVVIVVSVLTYIITTKNEAGAAKLSADRLEVQTLLLQNAMSDYSQRLSKVERSIEIITPTVQRIESAISKR